jgi:predicted O-methyltransferase YrrM
VDPAPNDTLQRLQAGGPPLRTDAWSLADETLLAVLSAIDDGARTIVECGSGRSTVIIARRLRELGAGSIHSLEHDPSWAEATRRQLAAEGLDRARVLSAPLEPHPLAGGAGWYSVQAVRQLPDGVDLLLIDGPPAGEPALHRSRHPTLSELQGYLAPGATIVLDDAGRPGEVAAIELWEKENGVRFAREPTIRLALAVWHL